MIARPVSNQPIPKHAKKVFSGTIFDTYQWEQQLFNNQKALFEKLKRTDTVTVIPITPEGKIVVSNQEQPGTKPFIGVLGGRIDEGETPLEAAKRELLEEAGMKAKEYILWEALQPLEKIDWAIYLFVAKGCETVQKQTPDAGEKIQLKHISFDDFITLSAQEDFRDKAISLKLFRCLLSKENLAQTKKLFLE